MARVLMLVLLVFGLLGSAVVHLLEWDNWAYTNEVIGPLFLGIQTLPSVCWVPLAIIVTNSGASPSITAARARVAGVQ